MNLAPWHFEASTRESVKSHERCGLVAVFWMLLFSPVAATASDLFSFGCDGKVLVFAVPNFGPVAATVKDSEAETIALNWAVRFYHARDVNFKGMEFRTGPARFWLVKLESNFGSANLTLYAVVLVDGSVVEPSVRELL
jgi:hypothetical protein